MSEVNYARLLIAQAGNLDAAIAALVKENENPSPPARYRFDEDGLIIDAPELQERLAQAEQDLGRRIRIGAVFKDDAANMTLRQQYNLGPLTGYDFENGKWAPAFGQFKEGEKFSYMQPTRYDAQPDVRNGGMKPVAIGQFDDYITGAHGINTFDDLLAELDAHPFNFKTRGSGAFEKGEGRTAKPAKSR